MNLLPCVVLALAAPADPHAANPVYQELLSGGIAISAKHKTKLPAPYMADGLNATAQRKILDKLRQELSSYEDVIDRPGNGSAFRFYERRQIMPADPNAPAFATDVWFVTYGDLKALARKDPQQLFAANPPGAETMVLGPAELAQRKITLNPNPLLRERYVNMVAQVQDLIEVGLTSHFVLSQGEESIVAASKVDPRFTKDEKFPNYWRRLPEKGGPKAKPGPMQPLEVGAVYVKITRLAEPKDALFVEFHQVATEPKEWPALSGKIRIQVDQEIKRFRLMALKTAPAP